MKHLTIMLVICLLAACASTEYDPYVAALDRQMERRAYQTRSFEDIAETDLMRAIVSTLQDHHFRLLKVDREFGAISAYQAATADSALGISGHFDITVLLNRENAHSVRVRASMRTGVDNPDDARLYQQFFTALEQKLSLQSQMGSL